MVCLLWPLVLVATLFSCGLGGSTAAAGAVGAAPVEGAAKPSTLCGNDADIVLAVDAGGTGGDLDLGLLNTDGTRQTSLLVSASVHTGWMRAVCSAANSVCCIFSASSW